MELQQKDMINASERFMVDKKKLKPAVDTVISKIVGKEVYAQDPRLFNLIVKYKKPKADNDFTPDNYLQNPEFITELKEIFI